MAVALFTNNAATTLSAGISGAATTVPVAVGTGALFPTPSGGDYFYATLIRASDSAREIVKCTARAGDSLTVVRAQEGTTALTFVSGDKVELRITAAGLATKFDKAGGTISGNVSVTGNVSAVDLAASGDLTVGDDLTVAGDTAVTGDATIGGNMTIGGDTIADSYASVHQTPALTELDLSTADHFKKSISTNPTWTFINPPAADKAFGFTLKIVQTGALTHIWPAAVKWVNGAAPTIAAGTHIVYLFTDDGGVTYNASIARGFA